MKQQIIGTGLSGLVGSRVVELLSDEFEFENLSLETGVNILNKEDVEKRFSASPARWVLHFAAKTDVDGCEKDKEKGQEGDAWKINVGGTQNIVNACTMYNKKIIHISTDFVFDGKKQEPYDENDLPNPISWYGVTKYEAEKVVQESNEANIICRIAFPYRASFPQKNDLAHAIMNRLKDGKEVIAVNDQIITPTFIDDIAMAIQLLINKDGKGIFHVTGSTSLSPFDLAIKIANAFSLDKNLIKPTSGEEYFRGRAMRPSHTAIKNDKIKALGVTMHTVGEGLEIIKEQLEF